jgi:hypothetical protein
MNHPQFSEKAILSVLLSKRTESIDTLDGYKELLRDCYGHRGMVNICGYEYDCADALEALDPIAFRCGLADYESSLISDDMAVEVCGDLYAIEDVNQAVEDLMESANLEDLLSEAVEDAQIDAQVALGIA